MVTFDAIVVGLGTHGSAAAAALSRRGLRVLGLERFGRGDAFGSSSGWTRMIRLAYFEDPIYVPLVRASWDRWRELEGETGVSLLTQTGGLYGGPTGSRPVAGAIRSAEEHGLAHEVIDADEIHRRWPIFEPAPDTVGLVEVQAGSIRIDRAIEAHLLVAERHGAMLEFGRRVVDWRPAGGGGFEVEDANGAVVGAAHLVLTAGPWLGAILPDLHLPLQVEREMPVLVQPDRRPGECRRGSPPGMGDDGWGNSVLRKAARSGVWPERVDPPLGYLRRSRRGRSGGRARGCRTYPVVPAGPDAEREWPPGERNGVSLHEHP